MRRNKHKHTRRAVTFYKINYGFHEPFKVLLDGNFIHAAVSINLSELESHISKLLGGRVKLYVTRCVTWELQDMGEECAQAIKVAKAQDLHKCGHAKGACTPADCILEQIGDHNHDRWWIATQDQALRDKVEQIPSCPVIFATINGIHLNEPPTMSKAAAKQVNEGQQALPAHERASEALKDLEAIRPRLKTNVAFRRKKAKGPNPLSVKKKKLKVAAEDKDLAAASKQAGLGSGGGQGTPGAGDKKKQRKRRRAGESSKVQASP